MNLKDIIAILVPLIIGLVPVLKAHLAKAKANTPLGYVSQLAHHAVAAAEALSKDGSGITSQQKLAFASEFLTSTATRLGVKLTTTEVMGFIHGALTDLKLYAGA